jgi:hypothetical protein
VDRGTRRLFAVLFAGVILVTVAAALVLSGTGPDDADPPPGTTSMTGVVVAVDSAGLGDVDGFTLRRPGGELVEFGLSRLENGIDFPPGHLAEHQATAEPVRVWYLTEGEDRLAIRLEDADS